MRIALQQCASFLGASSLALASIRQCSDSTKTSCQLSGCWLHFPQIVGNVPRGHPDNVSAYSQDPSSRVSLAKSHLTPPLCSTPITEASTLLDNSSCIVYRLRPCNRTNGSTPVRSIGTQALVGPPLGSLP